MLAAALDPRFRGQKLTSNVLCEPDAIKAALAKEMKKHTAQPPSVVAHEPQAKRKPEDKGLQALLHGAVYDATAVESESPAQEVARYCSERMEGIEIKPLDWWKCNSTRFPGLAVLAQRYLSITATSVPAERVFSACGVLVNKLCSSLAPSSIDAMIFLAKIKSQLHQSKPRKRRKCQLCLTWLLWSASLLSVAQIQSYLGPALTLILMPLSDTYMNTE